MKRGHVTGHKRERKPTNWYYASLTAADLAQIEATWRADQAQQQQQQPKQAA